jgi:hypothetical protein
VLKELLSLKPTLSATCITDVAGFTKRVIALSIRRLLTYW